MSNYNHRSHHAAYQGPRITVHGHDVLSGRGVSIALHSGNQRFRTLVCTRKDEAYCTSYSATEKKAVALEIVRHIQSLDPPGRFLKRPGRDPGNRGSLSGHWEVMPEREVIKKTTQALRDCNRQDRDGYAKSVQMPTDVAEIAQRRRELGWSGKEHAVRAAQSVASATNIAATGASRTREWGCVSPSVQSAAVMLKKQRTEENPQMGTLSSAGTSHATPGGSFSFSPVGHHESEFTSLVHAPPPPGAMVPSPGAPAAHTRTIYEPVVVKYQGASSPLGTNSSSPIFQNAPPSSNSAPIPAGYQVHPSTANTAPIPNSYALIRQSSSTSFHSVTAPADSAPAASYHGAPTTAGTQYVAAPTTSPSPSGVQQGIPALARTPEQSLYPAVSAPGSGMVTSDYHGVPAPGGGPAPTSYQHPGSYHQMPTITNLQRSPAPMLIPSPQTVGQSASADSTALYVGHMTSYEPVTESPVSYTRPLAPVPDACQPGAVHYTQPAVSTTTSYSGSTITYEPIAPHPGPNSSRGGASPIAPIAPAPAHGGINSGMTSPSPYPAPMPFAPTLHPVPIHPAPYIPAPAYVLASTPAVSLTDAYDQTTDFLSPSSGADLLISAANQSTAAADAQTLMEAAAVVAGAKWDAD